MKKLLREPVILFLLIGGTFYILHGWLADMNTPIDKRIVVSANQIEQLTARFSRTWMRPPNEDEIEGMIKERIRDEVYYREALALGLDKNDQVIQRRMRQKLELLMDNMASANVPSDQMLTTFMQENPDKFRTDHRIAFLHVYLDPDERQDLEADAQSMLQQLKAGVSPERVGDPTLIGYEFDLSTESNIARQFGTDFTMQLIDVTPGEWTGPLLSGLGAHLVKITEQEDGGMPEFKEIRVIVEREWMAKRTKEIKDTAFARLLEGYEVVYEEKEGGE